MPSHAERGNVYPKFFLIRLSKLVKTDFSSPLIGLWLQGSNVQAVNTLQVVLVAIGGIFVLPVGTGVTHTVSNQPPVQFKVAQVGFLLLEFAVDGQWECEFALINVQMGGGGNHVSFVIHNVCESLVPTVTHGFIQNRFKLRLTVKHKGNRTNRLAWAVRVLKNGSTVNVSRAI